MELPKKVRKPMMEKKRRARINDSLERLKEILLHNTAAVTHGSKPTKLEKADILEMTIRFIESMQPRGTRALRLPRSTSSPFESNPSETGGFLRSQTSSSLSSSLESESNQNVSISDKENTGVPRSESQHTSGVRRAERSAFRSVSNIDHGRSSNSASGELHWRPW